MPIFTPIQVPKLIELAKKNRIAPVYLFISHDENVCREKAREIYSVLQEKDSILEIYNLHEKEELKNFLKIKGYQEGLFGLRKIYLIFGAENITLEKGEEIIRNLEKGNNLFSWFFISEKMEENHPIYKYALEKGAIIPFISKRKEDYLEMELITNLKKFDKIMDKNTANLFISLVGEDYYHFRNELEKLIFYTGENKIITQEDVWNIVTPLESATLYLLGDAIFTAGPEKAYKLILNLLDNKIDPPLILGFLYKFFKRMQILAEFLEKYPDLKQENRYTFFAKKFEEIKNNPVEEVPKIIASTHPYPLFNMKRYLSQIEDFNKIFDELFHADISIKIEFKNPAKVFYQLLLNIWKNLKENHSKTSKISFS
ncbi:MAG: hypothetical protein DRP29_02235 [Thermodesulfobacteriota bacterium]|nr:MAG: hypothetical protein DRP29_02235 [Thermodesulfobacteriota bacterium]RLG10956.1 MAG: hypothetical protein DRN73_06560 [Candidatus Pacearchaeota archaeon]